MNQMDMIRLSELATGESDTLFGISITRTEVVILTLFLASIFFYVTMKIYGMVKYKHWCKKPNRIKAIKSVLNKSDKNLDELDKEDLITYNLITLYEYYDRSMDKCLDDLKKEFRNTEDFKEI